jgi:hypothetical protein
MMYKYFILNKKGFNRIKKFRLETWYFKQELRIDSYIWQDFILIFIRNDKIKEIEVERIFRLIIFRQV